MTISTNISHPLSEQHDILSVFQHLLDYPGPLYNEVVYDNLAPEKQLLASWHLKESKLFDFLANNAQEGGKGVLLIEKLLAFYRKQAIFYQQDPYQHYFLPAIGQYFAEPPTTGGGIYRTEKRYVSTEDKVQYQIVNHLNTEDKRYLLNLSSFGQVGNILRYSEILLHLQWEGLPKDIFDNVAPEFQKYVLDFIDERKAKTTASYLRMLDIANSIFETKALRTKVEQYVLENDAEKLQKTLSDPDNLQRLKTESYLQTLFILASTEKNWESLGVLSSNLEILSQMTSNRLSQRLHSYFIFGDHIQESFASNKEVKAKELLLEGERQKFFSIVGEKQKNLILSHLYSRLVEHFIYYPEEAFLNNQSSFATPEFFSHLPFYQIDRNHTEDLTNPRLVREQLQYKLSSEFFDKIFSSHTVEFQEQCSIFQKAFGQQFLDNLFKQTGTLSNVLLSDPKHHKIIDENVRYFIEAFPQSLDAIGTLFDLKKKQISLDHKMGFKAATPLLNALISSHTQVGFEVIDKSNNLEKLYVYNQKDAQGSSYNVIGNISDFLDQCSQPLNFEVFSYYLKKLDLTSLDTNDFLAVLPQATYIANGKKPAENTLLIMKDILPKLTEQEFKQFESKYQYYKNNYQTLSVSTKPKLEFFQDFHTQCFPSQTNLYSWNQPSNGQDKVFAKDIFGQLGIVIEHAKLERSLTPLTINSQTGLIEENAKRFKI